MIKATRNQLGVTKNFYQTQAPRVLCVCSAGLLRSPTMANTLHKTYGWNTRAVGACKDFALIPISEALIFWADRIVFVDQTAYNELDQDEKDHIKTCNKKVDILNLPDQFDWNDPSLIKEIEFQMKINLDSE